MTGSWTCFIFAVALHLGQKSIFSTNTLQVLIASYQVNRLQSKASSKLRKRPLILVFEAIAIVGKIKYSEWSELFVIWHQVVSSFHARLLMLSFQATNKILFSSTFDHEEAKTLSSASYLISKIRKLAKVSNLFPWIRCWIFFDHSER